MNETRVAEHTLEEHRTVSVSRQVPAPPDRVFDVWLDATKVRTWMAAPSAGEVVSSSLDPVVGGAFSFVVREDGANVLHAGEFLAIDRPRHLSFTWRVPRVSLETSVVTIDVAPLGEESEITLKHEGVLPEVEARTEQGWSTILESVAVLLTRPEETQRAT